APTQTFPMLVLLDGGYEQIDEWPGTIRRVLKPTIEGYVAADTPADLGPALEALHLAVLSAVLADRDLGGLAFETTEVTYEPVITRDPGAPSAAFTMTLAVDFLTAWNDPSAAG